jgi:hypothetical protein
VLRILVIDGNSAATQAQHVAVGVALAHYQGGVRIRNRSELDVLVTELLALHERPDDLRLAWRFGVGASITDAGIKLAELRNWLERQVIK